MTWTLAGDGLPPEDMPVLAETVHGEWCVATFEAGWGWSLVSCGAMVEDSGIDPVSKWMHIPEAD